MKQFIPLIFFTVLLSGCGEETKTIEYYSKHLDEAKNIAAECKKDTSTLSENCKNATNAVSEANYQKFMHGDGLSVGE